jgi:hypothetical protein
MNIKISAAHAIFAATFVKGLDKKNASAVPVLGIEAIEATADKAFLYRLQIAMAQSIWSIP